MLTWKLFRYALVIALALAVAAVIGLTLARTAGTWLMDRAEPGTDATPPGRIVDVGGTGVHVMERGAGDPIVLLHGVPGWSGDWPERLLGRLAERRRVIAIDLVGFGFSARPVNVGMDAWGAQVAAVLAALGETGVTVVGHDMGAIAALAAATSEGDAVARIVLVSPAVPVEDDAQTWRAFLPLVPGAGELVAGWSAALLVPRSAPAGLASGPWWEVPGTRRCTLAALRDGAPPDTLTRAVKDVRVPTLVLHGTADDVVPWTVARRWVPSIGGVLVRLVDGGGHWLPTERPDEIADAILGFLEEER